MSLHNLDTTLTPREHAALHHVVELTYRRLSEREDLSGADECLLQSCRAAGEVLQLLDEQARNPPCQCDEKKNTYARRS